MDTYAAACLLPTVFLVLGNLPKNTQSLKIHDKCAFKRAHRGCSLLYWVTVPIFSYEGLLRTSGERPWPGTWLRRPSSRREARPTSDLTGGSTLRSVPEVRISVLRRSQLVTLRFALTIEIHIDSPCQLHDA